MTALYILIAIYLVRAGVALAGVWRWAGGFKPESEY